jgi:hypothetical protein
VSNWKVKRSRRQPRVPKGTRRGGQFTSYVVPPLKDPPKGRYVKIGPCCGPETRLPIWEQIKPRWWPS